MNRFVNNKIILFGFRTFQSSPTTNRRVDSFRVYYETITEGDRDIVMDNEEERVCQSGHIRESLLFVSNRVSQKGWQLLEMFCHDFIPVPFSSEWESVHEEQTNSLYCDE